MIETSTRHSTALKQEIHELTVEDKMLSMAEIKIKDEIKLIQKEVVEVERLVVERTLLMRPHPRHLSNTPSW